MAVTNRYFVAPTSGSDSVAGVANGRDVLGLSLVNATYDHTGNGEGERHLSSAGAFSGYTFTSGDTIYLLNAVGGVSDGLYEIASKVDSDAILLVADSGLTADSTTDVDSSDGPWATTQYAANQVATTGSDIYLCNEATEFINALIDIDTNAGAISAQIRFMGATSLGVRDGSEKYTIKCGATFPGSTPMVDNTGASNIVYIAWHDVVFNATAESGGTDATSCIGQTTDNRTDGWTCAGCTMKNASGGGVVMRDDNFTMIDCDVFPANGGIGCGGHIRNRGNFHTYIGNRIHDNVGDGIFVGQKNATVVGNEVYDNGGIGIHLEDLAVDSFVVGNTCYINDGDNIQIESGANACVMGNTCAASTGGYGFNVAAADMDYMDYNHTHGNTSGPSSITMPGFNNHTGDPNFVDTTDGSENFTPKSGSVLVGNGPMGVSIGARSNSSYATSNKVVGD